MKQFLISTPNSQEKHSPAAEIVVGNVDLLTEMLLRVPVLSANENDIAVVFYNRGKVFSCNLECKPMKVLCELSPGEISDFTQVIVISNVCYVAVLSYAINRYDGFSYDFFCHLYGAN
ncbi:hypothetical protein RHSIM_Rhsim04G0064900 [Rhododendron simsii]|uniref:Uncharacterized protein n=1 Tax=Rhododendron simsii TaxID=118357 RepID=A0A834LR92_RHOSS|nr:hypothetical protein RHSIM_Rhsim04G0064900 [Rhododendron simsii]